MPTSEEHKRLTELAARWLKRNGFGVVATELNCRGSREQPLAGQGAFDSASSMPLPTATPIEEKDMSVMRCRNCNTTCFPDDAGEPVSECGACGSKDLECDHPGHYFDRGRQCFVCSFCGETSHRGVSELRRLASERPEFGIQNVMDTTDH